MNNMTTSNRPPKGREAYWKWWEPKIWRTHEIESDPQNSDLEYMRKEGAIFGAALVTFFPDGFKMLMIDQDEIAMDYFRKLEIFTREAIRIEDYHGFKKLGQENYAKYLQLRYLFLANWILTKERNEQLLREAMPWYQKMMDYATLFHDNKEKGWDVGLLLACYVELGDFERAIKEYQRLLLVDKIILPPKGLKWAEDSAHLMYVVASYLSGRQDLKEIAQKGMEHFYQKMTDWGSPFENDIHNDQKVIFAYIRGKYFTGETDPVQLIKNLRYGR